MLNKFLREAFVVSVSSLSVTAFAPAADAALLFTLQEQGNDVVGTLSGFLDLTGLAPRITGLNKFGFPFIQPNTESVGFLVSSTIDDYIFDTSVLSFGSGDFSNANSVGGSQVNIGVLNAVAVPQGYNGEPLDATITFNNTDLATLCATPGTYSAVFNPNTGDTITYQIGQPIPEPLTMLMLGASAAVAFGTAFKRRKAK